MERTNKSLKGDLLRFAGLHLKVQWEPLREPQSVSEQLELELEEWQE
jgi:hypothetical protein